jgi:hypothetical protein
VYLVVAVRTSQGPGPGVLELPPAEAASLVARKYAVYGSEPPADVRYEPAVLTTPAVTGRHTAVSN